MDIASMREYHDLYLKTDVLLLCDVFENFRDAKGIRGGTAQLAQRFAKVNNPYVEGFNADKPTNYLMYADADNLYGWDMSSYPPIGGFEWINTDVTNL